METVIVIVPIEVEIAYHEDLTPAHAAVQTSGLPPVVENFMKAMAIDKFEEEPSYCINNSWKRS